MSEKKTIKIFNKELLDECLSRDSAILIGDYNKLNRESKIKFTCNCGKEYDKNFRLMYESGGAYCNKCTDKNRADKIKINTLEQYGVEYSFQREDIKEKSKNTIKVRYGVDNVTQIPGIKEKAIKTNIQKYGVEHPQQNNEMKQRVRKNNLDKYGVVSTAMLDEVKEKAKHTNLERYGVKYTCQNQEVKAKGIATNLIKYGVENPFQSDICKNKSKETCLQKYGVEHCQQNQDIRKKVINTCNEIYGFDCPLQSPEIRAKGIATNLIKYGVEYPSQNLEIMEKTQKNAYKYKEYKMPSGIIKKVQGYESFALDELVKTYTEDQLKTDRKDVPRVEYMMEEKKHFYFPDIYIPHANKLIEVKSTWTFNKKNDITMAKAKSCKEKGYCFELWVYNGKGEKQVIIP